MGSKCDRCPPVRLFGLAQTPKCLEFGLVVSGTKPLAGLLRFGGQREVGGVVSGEQPLSLKAVGYVPFEGEPKVIEEGPDGKLLVQWTDEDSASGVAAINYRIPIPKLRRLAS